MSSQKNLMLPIMVFAVLAGAGGCELITRVDRSQIDELYQGAGASAGAGGADGGSGGMGGGGTGGMGGGGTGGMGGGGTGGMGGGGTGGTGGSGGTGGGGTGGMGGGSGGGGGMGGGGNGCVPTDDMNDCTDDVCNMDGTTAHQPKAAGETCSNGGIVCNGVGQCVQCLVSADCPGTDDACGQRTCTDGACGMDFTASDTPLSTQNAGDCKVVVCDGNGGTASKDDDADVPDDSNACTTDACVMGTPSNTNLPQGSDCTPSGGADPLVCNAMGQCVGCNVAANCPGMDDECRTRTCLAGVCGVDFTAADTPVSMQNAGDCKVIVCDGSGGTTSKDDNTDVSDDNNACTADVCIAGIPSHSNLPQGTQCAAPGGGDPFVCNGMGQCVECNAPADCPGTDDECKTRTCLASTCGVDFTGANTPVSIQTPNDCLVRVCDGAGNDVDIPDDTDVPVDDGETCTSEACAGGMPIHPHVANGTSCSDGEECTMADTCMMGACQPGTLIVCQPPDQCHEPGICNAMLGACTYAAKVDGFACDDGNGCTVIDQCMAGICSGTPAPDGTTCMLGGVMGACQSGMCSTCGNGVVDPPEECDDLNAVSGDGCNACIIELTCPAGESRVVVLNNNPLPIPDLGPFMYSPAVINATGGVTKAIVVVHSLTHEYAADIDMFLRSPHGLYRELSTDNGFVGNNYTRTTIDDAAAISITDITAPFTGKYRPEQSMATIGAGLDFLHLNANGFWYLQVQDDASGFEGMLNAWSLALCVNPASYCGDGVVDADEECDDGNTNGGDLCSNLCRLNDGCGDGNFDLGEECDDDNMVSGDGCSSACQVEVTCAAGETPVILTNDMTAAVPDDNAYHAFPVNVTTPGAVAKVVAVIGSIAHTNVQELDIQLQSPTGFIRTLSSNNGDTGDDYASTFFDDDAATDVTSGSAPFRGYFKPEQTLSTTGDANFRGKNAMGTWNLRIRDVQTTNFAVFNSWTVALCLSHGEYCGNGVIEAGEECDDANTNDGDACSNSCSMNDGCGDNNFDAGEECDDDNIVSGDGCSATCQVEITCDAGQVPVKVTNGTAATINGSSTLNQFPVNVAAAGAVKKAIAVIGNIPDVRNDRITIDLLSPIGTKRHLSSANGGTSIGGYTSTFFDDSAAVPITSSTHPMKGRYQPEESISTTVGTDFSNENPLGTWNLQIKLSGSTAGTLQSWTLGMCLDTVNYCGNGTLDPGEQCDDGNYNNNDLCSNACKNLGCGDGLYDVGEQCDDGNTVSGDGCSSTCTLEMDCAPGQTTVTALFETPTPIPVGGSVYHDYPVLVAPTGGVKKVKVALGFIDKSATKDLNLRLQSPFGTIRDLSMGNSGTNSTTGYDYLSTIFDDAATFSIASAPYPFSGTFRPEHSLSTVQGKDFLEEAASGTWNLQARIQLASSSSGTVYSWTLGLCVDTVKYCGNGTVDSGEECDDGNTTNNDGCSDICGLETGCGNGTIDAGEECDDDGFLSGDGCSPTCQVEIDCAPGQTRAVVADLSPSPIVDNTTTYTSVNMPTAGAVKKVVVTLGKVSHASVGQLSINLRSPANTIRWLSTLNGGTGDDYIATVFDSNASMPVTAVGAPFTGVFRPENTLTQYEGTDFLNQNALGSWSLGVADNTTGTAGTVERWSLALCLDTVVFCGNGVLDPGEECDDANTNDADACTRFCTANEGCGDGNIDLGEQCDDSNGAVGNDCSQTCEVAITCGAGETPIAVTNETPTPIPDNNLTFTSLPVNVATTGKVRKVIATIGGINHTADADLDIQLRSPSGTVRILSDDNGGTGDNYNTTIFDDSAGGMVVNASAPFRSKYRPEQSMSTTPGTDFLSEPAAGTWALEVRDDAATNVGTFLSWTLTMCVATECGDGNLGLGEECDDGNMVDNDLCSNGCQLNGGCGNGNVDVGEACDDDNLVSGDGCSPTCDVELTCAPGQTSIMVANDTPFAMPDANTFVDAPVSITTAGAVKKVVAVVGGITHPNAADVDIQLQSPIGTTRGLSNDRGGTDDNYRSTIFDDSATTGIAFATAPFSGRFRPEQTMSTTAGTDFADQNALGIWNLKVRDDAVGFLGTYESWRLLMCLDTVTYCGNAMVDSGEECDDGNQVDADACSNVCKKNEGCGDGNIDAGEWCDDNNVISGDGCSSTCVVEITCAPGETPVIVSDDPASAIPDTNTFIDFPLTVSTTGGIKKAMVVIRSIVHPNVADLDIQLLGPNGMVRNLSDDNGGVNDNYASTFIADSFTSAITGGSAPFSGKYRPEASLSVNPSVDFSLKNAAGTWTLQVRDDAATNAGTFHGWTLALCVDTASYCGDGMTGAGEECDDGNTVDNDACSNGCQFTDGCGDGNLDPGEQCDDNDVVSGDGCSATCQFDIACGNGEVPVLLSNTTATPIPENANGVLSTMDVVQPGVVRKVIPSVDITHAANSQVFVLLDSPYGVRRLLAAGLAGSNQTATIFNDDAAIAITGGTAPYTGRFRPAQTISNAAGFANQTAMGTWRLHVGDGTTGTVGTLKSWRLALCIDPSVTTVCGNGYVEPGETCDDGNTTSADGCSSTCQLEFTCPPGQVTIMQSSTDGPLLIPDNLSAGVQSVIKLGDAYTVTRAVVVVNSITHSVVGDLVTTLISPAGISVTLSANVGSSGDDYVSTVFDAGTATPIASGTAPFRGVYAPTGLLPNVTAQTSKGTWTLKVADDEGGAAGLLKSWTIALCGN